MHQGGKTNFSPKKKETKDKTKDKGRDRGEVGLGEVLSY
jgi:hypothetical protein